MITVLAPGAFCTVQDRGRPGWAHVGVGRAGAADRGAAALANRLVGNPAPSAVLEITLGGLAVRFQSAHTVALTGAPCPGLPWGSAVTVAAGRSIALGTPPHGLRSYLAVRGGIQVAPVLGSRSTDILGGLGPAPLRTGDVLAIGRAGGEPSGVSAIPLEPDPTLTVVFGPREDWFAPEAGRLLVGVEWIVRADSDRVGVRLDGPALPRVARGELPSEGTLPGALQVPPDGRPILLGPDAPVTGGYPVIAVVADASLDQAFQRRPGDSVRFMTGSSLRTQRV